MTFDEIQCEEVYDHELLEDVVEMRPSHDCYAGPDLRSNDDRSLVGLDDWQSDFPVTS
jgi:hypothetical protein